MCQTLLQIFSSMASVLKYCWFLFRSHVLSSFSLIDDNSKCFHHFCHRKNTGCRWYICGLSFWTIKTVWISGKTASDKAQCGADPKFAIFDLVYFTSWCINTFQVWWEMRHGFCFKFHGEYDSKNQLTFFNHYESPYSGFSIDSVDLV